MELTAFKTMPDELIRHIMGYARPTYGYMTELKLFYDYELCSQDWYERHDYNYGRYLVDEVCSHLRHKSHFINYKVFGEYCNIPFGEVGYKKKMVLIWI